MSLQIIAGPAGSGKTSYIVGKIADELAARQPGSLVYGAPPADARRGLSGSIILIVPDQATFQMERRILEDPRIVGFMDLHVLSFRRLALRVLEETGGLTLPFITRVGRSMAIQAILWEHREDLTVFAPLVNYPGFRGTLGRTLSELSQYGVTPASMRGIEAGEAQPFLDQKLHDLSLIFAWYREFLKDRFSDPDDYLEFAARRIPESSLVRGATVWVDGFSGLTPKEYKALRAVLTAADRVNLALCLDAAELGQPVNPAGLFHPTRETYEKVLEMAWDAGVPVDPVLLLEDPDRERGGVPPRWRDAPDLAALERNLRRATGAREVLQVSAPSVRVISATNPQAELEFVAREITKLVRDEHLRYRDITVEARDLTGYAEILPLVFGDHRIPFFLDRKRSLSHHPLAELIRAALDVVTTGWNSDPVFRYLKTDLAPVERSDVDYLENYVLAHGIAGEKWISSEPWRYARRYMTPEDEEGGTMATTLKEDAKVLAAARADGIRRQAVQGLEMFYRRLRAQGRGRGGALPASEVSQAICDLLLDLGVPAKLAEWQKLAEEAGDLAGARDHAGLWDKVMEILGQAGEILKDQVHDLKAYSLLIGAGLEDVRLGAIPPSLDQVLVGALDRSRQPDCRVTFLIGALLGVLPKRQTEDSIFTDGEREYLRQRGVDLEPVSNLRQFHERYLVYIALTRPSQKLYISYPLGDQEGKALTPSHVVGLVRQILPGVREEVMSGDPPGTMPEDLDYVLPARACGITVRRLALLRKGVVPGAAWIEAYRWLVAPHRIAATRRVLRSLSYSNRVAPLNHGLVRNLYGQTLLTSVSRLETFAACPFWHFARDGLRLREREVYRLEPADAGVFLHAALRDVVEQAGGSGWDWTDTTAGEVEELVDKSVEHLLTQAQDEVLMSSARYRYIASALRRILRRAGGTLLSHMKRGVMRPVAAEVLFGFPNGPRPLRIPLKGKEEILLRGQIDRVDAAPCSDGVYVRVVDYKSSPRSLDLLDVYNGLSLQLLVYLLVAMDSWGDIVGVVSGRQSAASAGSYATSAKPIPAGVLYFPVIDPLVSVPGPLDQEGADRQLARRLRMSGLIAGKPGDCTVARLMDADGSGFSDIIPVQFLASGGLGARSQVAPPDDLAALLEFVRDKVREMGSEVFSGRVDIAPYRQGTRRACRYCPYGPLCSFDILLDGNEYRILKSLSQGDVWDDVRKHRRHGGGV